MRRGAERLRAALLAFTMRRMTALVRRGLLLAGAASLVSVGATAAPSYADSGTGTSPGGNPVVLTILVIVTAVVGLGAKLWRASTAQKLAKGSGLDPGLATKMALMTQDGLDDTYLAASLRGQPGVAEPLAEPGGEAHSLQQTMNRLNQLKALLDQGAITQAEYDERRKAIVDSV